MSTTLLSVFRVAAVSAMAMGWAAACGSADSTTTSTPAPSVCLVYSGAGAQMTPDGGTTTKACPAGPCNYQTQAGCKATETCFPHYDATSNKVVPTCGAIGTQTTGEACNSADQLCARGFICVDGACAKACCGGDDSACETGERCIRQATAFLTSSGQKISYDEGLGTCAPINDCNVLDSVSTCKSDAKRPVCRVIDASGTVACRPTGDRDLGQACDSANQCGPGQMCAGYASGEASTNVATKCVRLCKWGDCRSKPACPEAEGPCIHFDRDPDGVGECTLGWQGKGADAGVIVEPAEAGPHDASGGSH